MCRFALASRVLVLATIWLILEALRSIRSGECDFALAGGTESCIGRISYNGFGSMHALSTHFNDHPEEGSRPFDKQRNGFVMGEGGSKEENWFIMQLC